MGFLPGAVDEKLRVETLAHQAALHVDLRDETVSIAPSATALPAPRA